MREIVKKKQSDIAFTGKQAAYHRPAVSGAIDITSYYSDNLPLQRAPTCACEGGCPRCAPAIHPKLKIGQPNDKYEQEADCVADQVMRMPEPKVQRQIEEDEEEEILQTKSIADQITPLVQRQIEPEEEEEEEPIQTKLIDGSVLQRQEGELDEEEEEEQIQARQADGQTAHVGPGLHARIKSMKGGGQPLPRSVRNFFEPRFGHDFSQVRVHTDARAAEAARAVNARAFTVGKNVVFGAGQYTPGSKAGQKLLGHELTHVAQQIMGSMPDRIQRWRGREHEKLSIEVIKGDYSDKFSWRAKEIISRNSGAMDTRILNYQWYVLPKIAVLGYLYKKTVFHYAREKKEAPNHGEANLYDPNVGTKKTNQNIERMNNYASDAIDKANKSGINDHSLLQLGHALHVAQDRGAHGEGEWGKGHSKKVDRAGKEWNCDDLDNNKIGKTEAKINSKEVLNLFINGLNSKRKTELRKAIIPEKSAIGGLELTTGVALIKHEPLFYAGAMIFRYFRRERVTGVFSPILSGGFAYYGGKKHMLTGETKVGLRVARITPRVYVNIHTGVAYGYNFSDDKVIAGLANALKIKYTGSKVDLGVVFKHVNDFIGNQNILVIGISGSF